MAIVAIERENGSLKVQSMPEGESKTEQSHRKGVNINTIVAKARKGVPARINNRQGLYGDFSSGMDFHTMLNRIKDAELDFMSLPAVVRSKFDNDAGKLLDFIANPENEEEARELGLLPDKADLESAEPVKADEAVSEATAPPGGSEAAG